MLAPCVGPGEGVACRVSQRAGFPHHMLPPDRLGETVLIIVGRGKQISNLQKPLEERQKNMVAGFHTTEVFS